MDYSNMQLLVMLILDGMLGILCGWSLRRWLHIEASTDVEATLQKDLELLQSSAARSCNMLSEAREALKRAEANAATLKDSLAARTAELAEAHTSISELRAAVVAELEPLVARPLAAAPPPARLQGHRNMNSSFVSRARRLAAI
jgi:septal ring factor EnvC (AmiA/AmiB activator)